MNMRKSKLGRDKQTRLIEHFVAGATARTAAVLVGVNHKTAAYYFHRLREIIYQATEDEVPFFGEIEVGESHSGGKSKRKRGQGAADMVLVFGLLRRGGKVHVKVIPNAKGKILKAIMDNKIVSDSIVYADTLGSDKVLDVSDVGHYQIKHSKLFADKQPHINAINNFWYQAKRHMRKFNGVSSENFPLFLKECEWRFNNPSPQSQLMQLKQWVKHYMG
jgi:transposase